jgi:aspartyl-tRNA(Asn)/glutamyl-tRNA(Gln) amidotransferase subunit A
MSTASSITSIEQCTSLLHSGQISAVELAQEYLSKIRQSDLNAFLHTDTELTLEQAKLADAQRAAGLATPITGVPIAHKDIFVTRQWRSTAGSRMLENYSSPFDATVVSQLLQAGTVNLGKLNCDEFAMGSGNENSAFGPTKNPWDKRAVPGGSSGGSAAAVAAGLALAATATDTGGSIRQPAAMCGVTGIKPTYGRVSRFGMIAFASSLDQGGVIARSANDCAAILSHMSGFDERDSTSLQIPQENYLTGMQSALNQLSPTPSKPLQGLKIGMPTEFFGTGVDRDVNDAVQAALKALEQLGAILVSISLPRTQLSIPAYYVIAPAEASSNLSRFDGVRYGHRAKHYSDLKSLYENSRAEGFGPEVRLRILMGSYVLSHGYYDAYYLKAQRLRRLIADDFQAALTGKSPSGPVDIIAGPVSPCAAWDIGAKNADPTQAYLADIFTLGVSLAGLPGMSIPCGFSAQNRPIGLQLIGNYLKESQLLAIANAFQQATDWHLQQPKTN